MKAKLLFLAFLGFLTTSAQNTYNLDWRMGMGSNVNLTIDQGDTVIWTWKDSSPHTVENEVGNSVETFNSGVISGMGETYAYTFTVAGDNRYFCGVHGANSMSGTITVNEVLSIEENELNKIHIYPNPSTSTLNIVLPKSIETGHITVFDIAAKQIYSEDFNTNTDVSINIVNWSPGSYYVKVISGDHTLTKNFIKN
jgi:hypothetical protein